MLTINLEKYRYRDFLKNLFSYITLQERHDEVIIKIISSIKYVKIEFCGENVMELH